MLKFIFNKKGISLIEVLVIIMVLGVIAYALSDLLGKVFQGSDKTRLLGSIKQNGQHALDIMTGKIRTSKYIVCISPDPGRRVLTVSKNDVYTRFIFVPQGASNGFILQDNVNATFLINTQAQANRLCAYPNDPNVSSVDQVYLTDNNSQTGVSLTTGQFSRFLSEDAVAIQFELRQRVGAPSTFFSQIGGTGTETFQTTVKLR